MDDEANMEKSSEGGIFNAFVADACRSFAKLSDYVESFLLRLETSGLSVVDHCLRDHSQAICRHANPALSAWLKSGFRTGLLWAVPRIARQLFTYHCGAICRKAPKLDNEGR